MSAHSHSIKNQADQPNVIQLKKVYYRYPNSRETALKNIDLSIKQGEMVFITGKSGSGKSTLMRLFSGLLLPSKGDCYVGGHRTHDLSLLSMIYLQRLIGKTFQDPMLIDDKTVRENLMLSLSILGYDHKRMQRRVNAAISQIGLNEYAECFPNVLSQGQRQRLSIGRSIIHHPNIILADEPTGNLDHQLATQIITLLNWFVQSGVTVIIISHDLHLIAEQKKRTLVIRHGELIEDIQPVRVKYSYLKMLTE